MKRLVSFLALAAASLSFAQSTPTADDQARFLAGLPPQEGSPLFDLAQRAEFARHAKGLDAAWEDIEKRQLGAIRGWMQETLPQLVTDTAPLLYVFSGPDFLHANTFYPNASTYVLCGIEPVGTPPDVTQLGGDSLDHSLRNLRNSLEAILSFSFFITSEMKNDFSANATKLNGTIPVIYTFLARSGCHIDSVDLIGLDKDGKEGPHEGSKHPGVKIGFTGKAGQKQTVYYFSTNLASYMIKQDPGFVRFCEALGAPNGFTKSASYLMHLEEFDLVRDLLLAKCTTLLQDDTGVRWKDFPREVWTPKAYGWYPGPIARFKEKYQSDLAAVYKAGDVPPIPFGIGYNWRPKMSTLIFAQAKREPAKALPVQE
ncbi:MAG: hypothetical protein IPK22_03705 [Verrucomicrobiaceae bacterium]|nr:hypothetical protein [Verrucomicrobiaceae bacterium]